MSPLAKSAGSRRSRMRCWVPGIGDVVTWGRPNGNVDLEILSIDYSSHVHGRVARRELPIP